MPKSPKESANKKNMPPEGTPPDSVLIKKYPNRRLYNTATSAYIVLSDIVDLINSDTPFVIQDKKSGEDITRSILNQIIFEQEVKPNDYHFSLELQKQLISMYSDTYSHMLPEYLTESMQLFTTEKNRMSGVLGDMVSKNTQAMVEFSQNMTRQNIELFNKSWQMFSPHTEDSTSSAPTQSTDNHVTEKADLEKELAVMKAEIEKLQQRLTSLK